MMREIHSWIALAAPWLMAVGAAVARDEPATAVPIAVRPAAAPVPALKYRLLPDGSSLVAGNAAVFYHRGIEMAMQQRMVGGGPKAGRDEPPEPDAVAEWLKCPLAAIPFDRARGWLQRNRRALHEAELGARRLSCDWEFDSRTDGFDLLINEVQEMRSLANLVALKARVAIRDQQYDEAIHWLQTGYAMARHVSQGPIQIPALVGVAICRTLNQPMEDLIQAPGAPNLYWALIDRPHPLIDLSAPLEGERFFLEREFPQLRELDGLAWSAEMGRAFVESTQTRLYRLSDWNAPGSLGWSSQETADWMNRAGIAALVARAYPEAKRALVARGYSPPRVEAMSTVQVVFLDAYRSYQVYRDDLYKWAGLPLHRSLEGMNRSERTLAEIRREPLRALFCGLVGSIQGSLTATAWVERRLDALAAVEAIRIHAVSHGRLPARLEDIAEAPVPLDPMTGQPFGYRLEAGRAHLSAPDPPGAPRVGYSLHYELTLLP